MDYFLICDMEFEYFYLYGVNFLREDKWYVFLNVKGVSLCGFQVYYIDFYFGDEIIVFFKKIILNLIWLKVENN